MGTAKSTVSSVSPFGNGLPGAASYQTLKYDNDTSKNLACIVLSAGKSRGGMSDGVFEVTAPMQALSIQQAVDFSVTKALDSDFMVATFGNMPIQIAIAGLHLLRMPNGSTAPITDWYKANRVSSNKKNRVKLSISFAGGDTCVYNCVVVGLVMEGSKESIMTGTITYKLILVGVEA